MCGKKCTVMKTLNSKGFRILKVVTKEGWGICERSQEYWDNLLKLVRAKHAQNFVLSRFFVMLHVILYTQVLKKIPKLNTKNTSYNPGVFMDQ